MLVNIGFTAFADGGEVPSDTASSKSETVKEETSKEQQKTERDFIKWVDFSVSYEALCAA